MHDIDRLLSERMQTKDSKQARKRKNAEKQESVPPQLPPVDYALLPPAPADKQGMGKHQALKRGRRSKATEQDNDPDFTPVRRPT
jgi:hypothetical protein